ncbi:MAG: putative lipopolysaccharide heptosyltransferase III [Chthoniobacterales bacterium]
MTIADRAVAELAEREFDGHRPPLQGKRAALKILLLQLKRIGDLVLTTPAIAGVRERYPDASITLVVSAACADLLPAIEGVDQTLTARGDWHDIQGWADLACSGRFDYCVDFTQNDRSAFLTFLSRAHKRITSDRVRARAWVGALTYNTLVSASVRNLHTVDYHLALVRPLGIGSEAARVTLAIPPAEQSRAREILRASGIGGPFVIAHPGSARAEKFWEPERWARVIDYCAEHQLQCVVTGTRSAIEHGHIEAIKSKAGATFVDLSGKIGLLTLAALIAQARFLLTVDSAPMHLAAATQTPQIALFGPTNPFHWRPRLSRAVILQAGQDAPMTEFSPETPGAPMKLISTEQVIDAMETLLSIPADPAV